MLLGERAPIDPDIRVYWDAYWRLKRLSAGEGIGAANLEAYLRATGRVHQFIEYADFMNIMDGAYHAKKEELRPKRKE